MTPHTSSILASSTAIYFGSDQTFLFWSHECRSLLSESTNFEIESSCFFSGCQDDDDFNKMILFVKESLWIYCQQTLVKIEPQKREQIPWNQFRIIFPNWRENCVYSKMLNTHTSLHSWSEIEAIFGKEGVVVDAGVEPISNSVPNLLPANLTGHKHSSSQRLHDQRRGKACKLVFREMKSSS